ncbi:hypothetical protein L9Z73_22840, partial [Pseudomonas sp. TNT11]
MKIAAQTLKGPLLNHGKDAVKTIAMSLFALSKQTNKTPVCVSKQGFWNLILTMTYSHMGKPHTTIGDAS